MIDAHVHLWGPDTANHPWREALPKQHPLRREAGIAALLATLPGPVAGIVHVEANPADGLAEARWVAAAAAALPCPVALVAQVPISATDAAARMAAAAGERGIVGIRASAAWHPDPARRKINDPHLIDSDAFGRAAQSAAELGLSLDLIITPFQAEAAAGLARRVPELRLVLNHCGGPMDSGPEGRAIWRDGLERLAENANVFIKLSPPALTGPGTTRDWLIDAVTACLDIFGASRAVYGSNWPKCSMPPARWAGVVAEAVAALSPAAQSRVWSGTARSLYFNGPRRPLPAAI